MWMTRFWLALLCAGAVALSARPAAAVSSAEFYTGTAYGFGRFEARMQFVAGDGVVGSFFLWKEGSELSGAYWNELDFEKVGATCELKTNVIHGNPPSFTNSRSYPLVPTACDTYRVYAYEWTPEAIVWLIDGVEVRRETGPAAAAFAQNAAAGMQIRFNVWVGDATFGGNFSPDILPVHQYVDWVQYSTYADGVFTLAWREDFNGPAPPVTWLTGSWSSPKNLSNHAPANVNVLDGNLVLSLTADGAQGPAGAMPEPSPSTAGTAGMAGMAGTAGTAGSGGSAGAGATSETSDDDGSASCSLGRSGPARPHGLLVAFAVAACAVLRRSARARNA